MFFKKKKVMDELTQAINGLMKYNNSENQKKVFDNLFIDNPNVHLAFISSSINTYVNHTFAPLTLISIDLDEYTKYYIIDPTNQNIISTITKEELEELFESKDYAFISADTKDVSGLELRNGGNYVR